MCWKKPINPGSAQRLIPILFTKCPRLFRTFVNSLWELIFERSLSEEMILDAIESKSSFNIIHLETMLKIDVFVLKDTRFHQQSLNRRKKDTIEENEVSINLFLASAEDIILHKMDWYRQIRQESEKQWLDILGVIKVQENRLDLDYLKKWARELELLDLLIKVFAEAGIDIR